MARFKRCQQRRRVSYPSQFVVGVSKQNRRIGIGRMRGMKFFKLSASLVPVPGPVVGHCEVHSHCIVLRKQLKHATILFNGSVELSRRCQRRSEVGARLNQVGIEGKRPLEIRDCRFQVAVLLRKLPLLQRGLSVPGTGLTRSGLNQQPRVQN